jgi:hypothetical protein
LIYSVIVLANGEMEKGANPEFIFKTWGEASDFITICMENAYSVEINPIPEEEE